MRHENCDGLTRRESAGAPLRISLLGSLRAVTGPSSQYANDYGCWSYVPFGNRQSQSMSITPCGSNPPLTSWAQYKDAVNGTNNNQVSRTNQNTLQASGKRAFTSKQIVSDYISAKLGAICRSPVCVCGERQVVLRVDAIAAKLTTDARMVEPQDPTRLLSEPFLSKARKLTKPLSLLNINSMACDPCNLRRTDCCRSHNAMLAGLATVLFTGCTA